MAAIAQLVGTEKHSSLAMGSSGRPILRSGLAMFLQAQVVEVQKPLKSGMKMYFQDQASKATNSRIPSFLLSLPMTTMMMKGTPIVFAGKFSKYFSEEVENLCATHNQTQEKSLVRLIAEEALWILASTDAKDYKKNTRFEIGDNGASCFLYFDREMVVVSNITFPSLFQKTEDAKAHYKSLCL